MTKIEELEQSIDEAVEKFRLEMNKFKAELEHIKDLAELKESKKENSGKWKPKIGEKYWFRSTDNLIGWLINNCHLDEWRINSIPVFQTGEECRKYWHFMDTVKEKSYEFSKEEWEDGSIKKIIISYDNTDGFFRTTVYWDVKMFGTIYFKTHEEAQYIIDNFKEELMEYWI